uniref:Uncharacterized protein n=1 Tax=Euplotes crassus TaxID=5936 RepID=A0A7S3KUF9_EUPCR|mmetsp:Transcript_9066/g.8650  ORF Transcript_9066/g.8650 Transcript_9066/m.8650 type:complete len:1271 (+) Transcript_9066:2317-6129(+)
MTEAAYCALECTGIGDGTGTYIESVGKCECSTVGDYDSGCAAASCTTNKYIEYDCDGKTTVYNSDGTVATSAYDPSTISGVYGDFKCTRSDCKCTTSSLTVSGDRFVYDFQESKVAQRILRNLGIPTKRRLEGRDLATTTTITNPITCVTAGNMVEFNVDSTTKSYPVYMKDSLLNTNSKFDYAGFLNLATTIEGGTATVSTYVHTFDTEGTYVFMNSLNNYMQTIIRVVSTTSSCASTTSVSAATLASLYSLNLSTTSETKTVDMTFFIRVIATKIGLLVLLVGFVTYMHSLDKNWTFLPFLRKKKEEEEEMEKRKRAKQQEKKVRLKADELKDIRDDLAAHVEKLKRRIEELERERAQKDSGDRRSQINNKLLIELRNIRKELKKKAKVIRNENGHDFEKDKQNMKIQKTFSKPVDDPSLLARKRFEKDKEDERKYDLPEDLRNQIDEDVENREFQRLDKAQEDNRQQVSNYLDEERKKLEDRLRSEGKLSESEIENILNDYDMHTRDMALILQEDERRQQENFKRQLEARKNRRKKIFNDIDKLKIERAQAKEVEAKELEEHFKKMQEKENYVIGKILVDEEKEMRKDLDGELENKKKNRLKNYVDKMKRTKDKDEFKKVLDEYNDKLKTVEDELQNERKRALMEIERKMAERKKREREKIAQMKPEESSVDIKGIEDKIQVKMDLLKKEADDEAAAMLEEERRKRNISQELAMLRKQNDEQVKHLRDLNQQKYEDFCRELNAKYDEEKLGRLIDLNAGSDGLQAMREELADSVSLLKHSSDPEEKKELTYKINDLRERIKQTKKDGKEDEKIKKNNQLMQERAKMIAEKEKKRKEFRWNQFQEEEKEREKLRALEREDWLRREKEAVDAVVDKYMTAGDMQGLAEVLDQAYGAGSKIYAERLLDLNNKLQEQKTRRMKYNFNNNLDQKIHDIEELNRVMTPQLERLNAKKNLISEDDYKSQLKDLMMKENEKRAEIEALAASREQDSQSKTMIDFVEMQKDLIDGLNGDMKDLREYAFKPHKVKDKHLKNEIKKLNEKYDKELEKMKKEEDEDKKNQIEEIKNRYKKDDNLLEKQLDDYRDNLEKFKQHNKNFMANQLSREKEKLGNELTEDEKALLMAKYERKMANLNKALEKEHDRQMKDHSSQLREKQKEIDNRRREREILLNNLSMYKESRAKQIAYEDNFDKLAALMEEDLELIDQEAYSGPRMQIYDLIKFKRESDEYLDVLRGDVGLLDRVKRIENHVQSIENSYKSKKKTEERAQKEQ